MRASSSVSDVLAQESKIFGVEIHSRFVAESIEIALQPLVGPLATHVVKVSQEIPVGVQPSSPISRREQKEWLSTQEPSAERKDLAEVWQEHGRDTLEMAERARHEAGVVVAVTPPD
jgi:hypothetical protein